MKKQNTWFLNLRKLNTKLTLKQKKQYINSYELKIDKAKNKKITLKSKLNTFEDLAIKKIEKIEEKFKAREARINSKINYIEKNLKLKISKAEKDANKKKFKLKKNKFFEEKTKAINEKLINTIIEIEQQLGAKKAEFKKALIIAKKKKIQNTKQVKFNSIYIGAEIRELDNLIQDYKILINKISQDHFFEYFKKFKRDKKLRKLKREEEQTNKNYMRPIMKAANKMANQRHLMAIRNGVVLTMPLIIVGSLFLIIANFPISQSNSATNRFLVDLMPLKWKEAFTSIFSILMGVISIVVAFGVASSLGRSYKLDRTTAGVLGFVSFILWVFPGTLIKSDSLPYSVMVLGSPTEAYIATDVIKNAGLELSSLGSGGMFAAIFTSIIIVELYRFVLKYNITIRLPKQVPQAVSNSFLILVPIFFYSVVVFFMGYIFRVDLIHGLNKMVSPLNAFLTENLGGVSLLVLLITLFWSVGLHGVAIFNAVVRPIWTRVIIENSQNYENGLPVTHAYPEQFLQWTVWIGGAGATLGLVIMTLIFARSKQLKAVGRASILPGLFNINEPVIFGYPIMLNILMIIPFILAPQVLVYSSWLFQEQLLHYDWVAVTPWTLPGPVGAFFSSGSNWKAMITALVNIIISAIIYLPFLLMYDKQLLTTEKDALKKEKSAIEKNEGIVLNQ